MGRLYGVPVLLSLALGSGCVDLAPPWEGTRRDSGRAGDTDADIMAGGVITLGSGGRGGDPGTGGSEGTSVDGRSDETEPDCCASADKLDGGQASPDLPIVADDTADAPAISYAEDGGIAGGGTGGSSGYGGGAGTGGSVGSGGVPGTGGSIGSGGAPGTGGNLGSGGAGTGGSTGLGGFGGYAPYNCGAAIVPGNGSDGLVTDFSDWNATTKVWGKAGGLYGEAHYYSGNGGTINPPAIEGSPVGIHLTGSIPYAGYGGGGVTFLACATVAKFKQIQFDIYGRAPNASLELQIQTYDQRPTDLVPAGTCDRQKGATCFQFPTLQQIVDVSSAPITSPRTVTVPLSSFSSWSASAANQVIGLQWQFTNLVNGSTSAVDVTVTKIRFLP